MRYLLAALLLLLAACPYRPLSTHEVGGGFESQSFGAVWDDPQRCASVVAAGAMLNKEPGRLRLGTWNVKWFPDGQAKDRTSYHGGTHIEWLACAIAYLDVDVLALQEVKLNERGRAALRQLTDALEQHTGSGWLWEVDACPAPDRQHVALLYRLDRVEVTHVVSHGAIDPTTNREPGASAGCPGFLRPALGAYVRSRQGGADFHFIGVHLDAGRARRDFRHRKIAWERLATVIAQRTALAEDHDVIVAGDFNMMGCPKCGVAASADERTLLMQTLAELTPPLAAAAPSVACSHYYRGEAFLLDQILYSRAMQEASGGAELVSGICDASRCEAISTEQLPALVRLSDHCPVVMDVLDRDLDDATTVDAPPSAAP